MTMSFLRNPIPPHGDDPGASRFLGPSSAELLERYLDDQLDPRERQVFEKSLESDAVLREHLELQRRIDAGLRSNFAPGDLASALEPTESASGLPETVTAPAAAPTTTQRVPASRRVSWIRIAAMVALFMGGYFLYVGWFLPAKVPVRPLVAPGAAYAFEVESGMRPYVVCTNSDEFASYTNVRLGTALAIAPTEGLTLIGWSYNQRVFSDKTVTMLATMKGEPVIIFMDHAENAGHASGRACDAKLDTASRTIGNVLLCEVRPKGTPSLLDQFSLANK